MVEAESNISHGPPTRPVTDSDPVADAIKEARAEFSARNAAGHNPTAGEVATKIDGIKQDAQTAGESFGALQAKLSEYTRPSDRALIRESFQKGVAQKSSGAASKSSGRR